MKNNTKVLVIGAGSAGCHLTRAFKSCGCEVALFDIDDEAIKRTRTATYVHRYGGWPKDIHTFTDPAEIKGYDVYAIATPPSVRLEYLRQLRFLKPKGIFIEKPVAIGDEIEQVRVLCEELRNKQGIITWVNYNHLFSPAIPAMLEQLEVLRGGDEDDVEYILVQWRENLSYINKAHWWIAPSKTYLVDVDMGGGSMYEHSHGIALMNMLFEWCDMHPGDGNAVHSSYVCHMDDKFNYDRTSVITISGKDSGHGIATCVTDFVSDPPIKRAQINGAGWTISVDFANAAADFVMWKGRDGETGEHVFPKTRELEFKRSVDFFLNKMHDPDTVKWETLPYSINTAALINGALTRHAERT